MSAPLDELYLTWLYSQVGSVKLKDPARTYWSLLRHLYTNEFVWFVPNDDNRMEDGRELRKEFIREQDIDYIDFEWLELGCSVLEMLIGLSRRLSFQAEGEARGWFWMLVDNLGLLEFTDAELGDDPAKHRYVDRTIERMVQRGYKRNGEGGLFPLHHAREDQRRVEIWYQMHAFLLENY